MTEETKLILKELQKMDQKISGLDEKFTGLEKRFTGLEKRFDGLEERLIGLEEKVSDLDERLSGNIKSIKITLESEINRNIMAIAEGHLNLNKKLDESLTVNQDKEILILRVNRLETELRELKEQFGIA